MLGSKKPRLEIFFLRKSGEVIKSYYLIRLTYFYIHRVKVKNFDKGEHYLRKDLLLNRRVSTRTYKVVPVDVSLDLLVLFYGLFVSSFI